MLPSVEDEGQNQWTWFRSSTSVHWTQSDGNMCLKVDTCHYLNKSSIIGH